MSDPIPAQAVPGIEHVEQIDPELAAQITALRTTPGEVASEAITIIDALLHTIATADRPDPCDMRHQQPFDFAHCETHDTTFALGDTCEWNGVTSIYQHLEDKADKQRARAVIAEMHSQEDALKGYIDGMSKAAAIVTALGEGTSDAPQPYVAAAAAIKEATPPFHG